MATSSIKLIYFNMPGRAEPARLLLHMAGVPFEDVRLSQEEFQARKSEFPYGQLPVLVLDDKVIPQSFAISRYAAKLAGLYPTDPLDAAEVDEVVQVTLDVERDLLPMWTAKTDERRTELAAHVHAEVFPRYMGGLNAKLGRTSGPFLLGNEMTLGDIWIYSMIQFLTAFAVYELKDAERAGYTRLCELCSAVEAHPGVRAYYSTRMPGSE